FRSYVRILFEVSPNRSDRLARRLVKRFPRIGTLLDQVGDQHPGDRAVRHPHPGIAGDDVYVVPRSRIPADERQAIEGLHDLAGPPKFDAVDHGEAFAGPPFEATMPSFSIVRLSRFVIFTADNQDLV